MNVNISLDLTGSVTNNNLLKRTKRNGDSDSAGDKNKINIIGV